MATLAISAAALLIYAALALVNPEVAQTAGIGFIAAMLIPGCWRLFHPQDPPQRPRK